MTKLVSVDFEVFGLVQGVFFRKSTHQEAFKLGVRGWCRNTRYDTVEGYLEGEENKVTEMKHWLSSIGSRSSKIDKAVFKNDKDLAEYTMEKFEVRK